MRVRGGGSLEDPSFLGRWRPLNKDKEEGFWRLTRKQVCGEDQKSRSFRSEGQQRVTEGSRSRTVTWDGKERGILN